MKIKRVVQNWLLIGVVLVLVQVLLGGITRLTDSGLSITEWNVIQGTLPPLNDSEWNHAFSLYKSAANKQFRSLHFDMTITEFKWIFFWEYIHRLWARSMGLAFIFPFGYFLYRKWLPKWLLVRLSIVIGLASLAAVFGIIMVYSGLNDDLRTWVSAYKLSFHLLIAVFLIGYLFFTWRLSLNRGHVLLKKPPAVLSFLLIILVVQIFFGGLMAGMRAALIHPYFSIFYNFDQFMQIITSVNFNASNYENNGFIKAIVQLLHRGNALFILILSLVMLWKVDLRKSKLLKTYVYMFICLLVIQIFLGIFTISYSSFGVPVFLGAVHQLVGFCLLLNALLIKSIYK